MGWQLAGRLVRHTMPACRKGPKEMKQQVITLEDITLDVGAHGDMFRGKACIMEAAALLAGKPKTDHPPCVSPTIGAFLRPMNDGPFKAHLDLLKPYAPRLLNTVADAQIEQQRAWLLQDYATRVFAPLAFDAAELTEEAAKLRALAPVVDEATAKVAAAWAAEGG